MVDHLFKRRSIGSLLVMSCAFLWATDSLFRNKLLQNIHPALIIFIEHALGFSLCALIACIHKKSKLEILRASHAFAFVFIGVFGSALGIFFFTKAFMYMNPSIVILLQKLQPIFVTIGAMFFLREKPKVHFYFWGTIALCAAWFVSAPDPFALSLKWPFQGAFYAIAAAFIWAMSTLLGKWVSPHYSSQTITGLRFFFGLLGSIAIVAFSDSSFEVLGNIQGFDWKQLIYMALIPGFLATELYYKGLQKIPASVATFAELFFPIAAMALNYKYLNLTLTIPQIIGSIFLMISIYFMNKNS